MPVDAVLKRAQLEQRFDVEGLRLLTLPSTRTVHGRVGRPPAFFAGSSLSTPNS